MCRTLSSSCTLEAATARATQACCSRTAGSHPAACQDPHPQRPGSRTWQRSTSRRSPSCACPVPQHCSHQRLNLSTSLLDCCWCLCLRLRWKHSCPRTAPISRCGHVLHSMKLPATYLRFFWNPQKTKGDARALSVLMLHQAATHNNLCHNLSMTCACFAGVPCRQQRGLQEGQGPVQVRARAGPQQARTSALQVRRSVTACLHPHCTCAVSCTPCWVGLHHTCS